MNSGIQEKENKLNNFRVYYISSYDLLEGACSRADYLRKWNYWGMFGTDNEHFEALPDYFKNLEDILNTVEKYTNYTLFTISAVNDTHCHRTMLVFKTK